MAAKFTFRFSVLTIVTLALLGIYFATVVKTGRDTYWHLAIGRRVFEEKAIPKIDTFTYGSPDTHFTSTEWLSGLIMYTFVQTLGFNTGLLLLRIVIGLATIYSLFLTLKLITSNEIITLAGISLVGFVLAIRLNDRPEIFSFVFVALVNYVCFFYFIKQKLSRLTYLLPIIFLSWPNIHPFSLWGIASLILWITIFLSDKNLRQLRSIKKFTGIVLLSFLASILQAERLLFSFFAFSPLFAGILEWASLPKRLFANNGFDFFNQVPIELYFYLGFLAAFLFSSAILFKKGLNNSKLHILIFYFLLSLAAIKFFRLIPIAILSATPILFFVAKEFFGELRQIIPISTRLLFFVLVLLIIESTLTKNIFGQRITAFVVTDNSTEPPKIVQIVNHTWKPDSPESATKIIKDHLQTQRLFSQGTWNDFFLWNLPQIKTFSDIMYQYRTDQDFQDEKTISSGGENWQELIKKNGIDTIVNPQDLPYIWVKTPVWQLASWKLVYIDEVAVIYARDDVIKSLPVDLSVIQPELSTALKFKPENETKALEQLEKLIAYDDKNAFARSQLIQYYIEKDINRAKSLTEESRNLIPKDPIFSVLLAQIYSKQNQCAQAREFAKEAQRKSFNHIIIKGMTNEAVAKCGFSI